TEKRLYPVAIPGMEGRNVAVAPPTLTLSANLIVDGVVAPYGSGKNQRVLVLNSGQAVVAEFKTQLVDPLPKLAINGTPIVYAPPFAWYDWVVAVLPLSLLFLGGAIGGFVGGLAASINGIILRSSIPPVLRYLCVLGVGFIAWVLFLAAATAFQLSMHSHGR
ncbi:MAG: hypothetical protein ACLQVD_19330, partial [Capsulimonadaceae bacterium]